MTREALQVGRHVGADEERERDGHAENRDLAPPCGRIPKRHARRAAHPDDDQDEPGERDEREDSHVRTDTEALAQPVAQCRY